MRALVLDDSKAVREILGRILKQEGFEVLEADNGLTALERLRDSGFVDLVLVDWRMPGMNGVEFIAALRALPGFRDTRVLMVTGETDEAQLALARAAGADDFLIKPFEKQGMVSKLQSLGLKPPDESGRVELTMQRIQGEIRRVTENTWTYMLGLDIDPDPTPGSKFKGREGLRGRVDLSGSWEGMLILECSKEIALRATSIIFAVAPEVASASAVHDTVGELANIIGGHVKGLFAAPCNLSLPTVTQGFSESAPSGECVARLDFLSGGEPVRVSLVKYAF